MREMRYRCDSLRLQDDGTVDFSALVPPDDVAEVPAIFGAVDAPHHSDGRCDRVAAETISFTVSVEDAPKIGDTFHMLIFADQAPSPVAAP